MQHCSTLPPIRFDDMDTTGSEIQSRGLLLHLMAFIGTYMPWTISFIPPTDYAWANWLSPILVIGGISLAIFSPAPQNSLQSGAPSSGQ